METISINPVVTPDIQLILARKSACNVSLWYHGVESAWGLSPGSEDVHLRCSCDQNISTYYSPIGNIPKDIFQTDHLQKCLLCIVLL